MSLASTLFQRNVGIKPSGELSLAELADVFFGRLKSVKDDTNAGNAGMLHRKPHLPIVSLISCLESHLGDVELKTYETLWYQSHIKLTGESIATAR